MALPGGFVHTDKDQTINDTLLRSLATKIGITPDYITRLEFDGNITRDPRGWSITCLYLCIIDELTGETNNLNWWALSIVEYFDNSAT